MVEQAFKGTQLAIVKKALSLKEKKLSNNGLFIIESETKKSTVFQNKLTESEIISLKMRK